MSRSCPAVTSAARSARKLTEQLAPLATLAKVAERLSVWASCVSGVQPLKVTEAGDIVSSGGRSSCTLTSKACRPAGDTSSKV